jgi:hypothetical protein
MNNHVEDLHLLLANTERWGLQKSAGSANINHVVQNAINPCRGLNHFVQLAGVFDRV